MFDITNEIYTNADKAREHLEAIHWPHGPICPHCRNSDQTRITKLEGKSTRPGVHKCKECRKPFSVTVGTVFERSHIPLNKWVLASHLMAASKKGMSAHQLHRMLGVTYKTAWFMAHRIREAMAPSADEKGPLGGPGKTVEADTTYIGGKEKNKHLSKRNSRNIGGMGKQVVHTLVERGGRARSHHIANVSGKTLRPILVSQVDRKSTLMTDTHGGYHKVGKEFARHEMVDHGVHEYVRGDAYSNTAEAYFSILKRGIIGIYHHVSEAHLKRYLAEFDFRYNYRAALKVSDSERADKLLAGARDKRLTYRRTGEAAYA
jgi:transposase-like protein